MKTILLLVALSAAAPVLAQDAAMTVSAQQPLNAVLAAAQTAKVTAVVTLKNGVTYTSKIKEAGSNAVVLSGPAGKEFYDVYIPLTEISSVELRVRSK